MMPQHSKRSFAKTNYQINYEESNIGWEKGALWACGTAFTIVAVCISSSTGSVDLIDKILPFSFGQARQGAYFPPHCRYITPYDDIVREHKRKQKRLEKFNMQLNDTEEEE